MATQTDPYYWQRDMQQLNAQQKALGQTKGFTPEQLSGIIQGNFAAQQQNEITQRNLALSERKQSADEAQQKRQNKSGMYSGLATVALTAPTAIKGYQDIFGATKGAQAGATTGYTGGSAAITGVGAGAGSSAITTGTGVSGSTIEGIDAAYAVNAPSVASQAAINSGEIGTTAAIGYDAAAAQVGYMGGRAIVHGKESPWAGVVGSTAAGAGMGAAVGGGPGAVVGGVVGLVVGVLDNFFSGAWKI